MLELNKDNFEKELKENKILILDAWAIWCSPCKATSPIFEELSKEIKNVKAGEEAKIIEDAPVIKIVAVILRNALEGNASDIHIEPMDSTIRVRFRIDGVLQSTLSLPKNLLSAIVTRIKILSEMKIDETRLPQDGRFKIETGEYKISFRVSLIPVYDGEKIVMRLLREEGHTTSLAAWVCAGKLWSGCSAPFVGPAECFS